MDAIVGLNTLCDNKGNPITVAYSANITTTTVEELFQAGLAKPVIFAGKAEEGVVFARILHQDGVFWQRQRLHKTTDRRHPCYEKNA